MGGGWRRGWRRCLGVLLPGCVDPCSLMFCCWPARSRVYGFVPFVCLFLVSFSNSPMLHIVLKLIKRTYPHHVHPSRPFIYSPFSYTPCKSHNTSTTILFYVFESVLPTGSYSPLFCVLGLLYIRTTIYLASPFPTDFRIYIILFFLVRSFMCSLAPRVIFRPCGLVHRSLFLAFFHLGVSMLLS